MFSIKKKLHPSLKYAIDNDDFKTYRVLIHCNSLIKSTEKKLKIQKDCFICTIAELNCICAVISARTILRLAELPEIDFITFDEIAEICASKTTGEKNEATESKTNVNPCPQKICIGIIDTGVFPNDDLINPSNKITKFVDLINGLEYPYDDNGHGTFMCGLIAGSGYKSNGLYKGICKNSNLYCVKAFNGIGKAFISNIFLAVHHLLEESTLFNIRVICMPFEIYSQDKFILSLFHKLFNLIYEKNIILVVSSGSNENFKNSIRGFASFDNCITVSGVNTHLKHSIESYSYSSCGPCSKHSKPDLCAPCVNLCSLNCDTNYISERNGAKLYPHKLKEIYTTYTGTSCSAAYISGVCALLLENNPELKPKDVTSLLKASCRMLNLPKWQQGNGLVDLENLLNE